MARQNAALERAVARLIEIGEVRLKLSVELVVRSLWLLEDVSAFYRGSEREEVS
jgi:hypothetical protein